MAQDYSKEEFGDVWLEYLPYCKGTTVYRYGSRENEPIQPVPREQWEEVIAQNEIKNEMTVDEFLSLDCPGGVCEVPHQWATEKVADAA